MKDRWLKERLEDPSLLDRAVDVGDTAVPIGGKRRGGFVSLFSISECEQAVDVLRQHEGFPRLRIDPGGDPEVCDCVCWGDDRPDLPRMGKRVSYNEVAWAYHAVDDGRYFGYSEPAIRRYVVKQYGRSVANLVMDPPDPSIAYHEAGHAVIAYFEDRGLVYATIIPDKAENTLGHVLCDDGWRRWFRRHKQRFANGEVTPQQRAFLEKAIITGYAGMLAEMRFLGLKKAKRATMVRADQDLHNLIELAMAVNGGNMETTNAYLHWLETTAQCAVRTRWEEIESVASALLVNKTLSADQIGEAIQTGLVSRSGK